jgi:hypothetical protein
LRLDFRRHRGENYQKKQRSHGTQLEGPPHSLRPNADLLCKKVPIPLFSHSFLVLVDRCRLISMTVADDT